MSTSTGLLSGTPTVSGTFNFTVKVTDASAQVATRPVTIAIIGKPAAPAAPTAIAGVLSATVTWVAPASNGSPITGYIVTPYLDGAAQTAITYDASTTTRTLTGLTAGGSYTFTVAAINAYGTGTASPASTAVRSTPCPAPRRSPQRQGRHSSATLTWTAPASNGGSAITGYVVTPYIGTVAQTPQTFTGTATTQTVTGLTPGTALHVHGRRHQRWPAPGRRRPQSAAVTPNTLPTLTFPAPPAGEVGVAYSRQLTVTDGTAPSSGRSAAAPCRPG